jgi:hypothetical protein
MLRRTLAIRRSTIGGPVLSGQFVTGVTLAGPDCVDQSSSVD